MACVSLCLYLVVAGCLAAVATATTTRSQLMLQFHVATGDLPTQTLYPEFERRIAKALSLPKHSVALGPLLETSRIQSHTAFTIQSRNVTVLDSYVTPDAYKVYLEKWRKVLSSADPALMEPSFYLDRAQMLIDPTYSELTENSTTVGQGSDPVPPPTTPLHDLQQSVEQRYEVMQLRLLGVDPFKFTLSYHPVDHVIDGLRTCLSTLLAIPKDETQLFRVAFDTNSSLVLQFTVHPASDEKLKAYSKDWTEAMALSAPAIKASFPNADFTFPATARTGVPTPPPAPTSSSPAAEAPASVNAGLVAGSVVGALAAVGALGGATYWLKRRRDAKKEADGAAQQDEDDEEDSEAPDDDQQQNSVSARH